MKHRICIDVFTPMSFPDLPDGWIGVTENQEVVFYSPDTDSGEQETKDLLFRLLYGPQPLDAVGVLATLLAVTGTLTVQDAANAVGLTADDLIVEAQAWAVAGS